MREVLAFERWPMLATDFLIELHAARTGPLGRSVSCVGGKNANKFPPPLERRMLLC